MLVSAGYMFPSFITGTMAVVFRADLGIDEAHVGTFISVFFGVGALLLPLAGRLADRKLTVAIRVAILCAAGCLLTVAVFGRHLAGWYAAMALGGVGAALGAPLGGLLIVRNVPMRRRSLAFAIERSAVPGSTLLAGLAVPTLAQLLPWQGVFAVAGVVIAFIALLPVPAGDAPAPAIDGAGGGRIRPWPSLLAMSVAFGLGSAAASAMSTFFVDHGVRTGFSPGTAGTILAAGSAMTIAARLALSLTGIAPSSRWLLAAMMGFGAAGFALLATEDAVWVLLGVVLACGVGWGWTGVASLAVVNAHARTPGAATGVLQAGGCLGCMSGPLLFGALAEAHSYPVAWTAIAVALGLAAPLTLASLTIWRRQPGRGDPATSADQPAAAAS